MSDSCKHNWTKRVLWNGRCVLCMSDDIERLNALWECEHEIVLRLTRERDSTRALYVDSMAERDRLTSENKLQWENIQKLLAENERLLQERSVEAEKVHILESQCERLTRERHDCLRATLERINERCTEYLSLGGLFNPEMMEHDKVGKMVRDIVRDAREALRGGE